MKREKERKRKREIKKEREREKDEFESFGTKWNYLFRFLFNNILQKGIINELESNRESEAKRKRDFLKRGDNKRGKKKERVKKKRKNKWNNR